MKFPLAIACIAVATSALAQDRAEIDTAKIVGNRELPKVLYIVPWKKPVPGQLSGKPAASVLDEVLAPVDREVFRRQVNYAGQVQAQLTAKAVQPAAPPADKTESPKPATPVPAGAPR